VDTSASTLTVHVYPGGLFSPALHEHYFVPTKWRGQVCFPRSSIRQVTVDIRVAADALEDRQRALSEEDRRTVQRQVREDVLQAAQHPEIRSAAEHFEIESSGHERASGVLRGHLSLRGRRQAVDVPVQVVWSGDRLRVTGDIRFKQSDFGIEPYSRFLGTVGVKDELRVEFALEAEPPGTSLTHELPSARVVKG
jgi:polyisoprenoid-binding protein YceI